MTDRRTRRADVTHLLKAWRQGQGEALEQLLPIVYGELQRMARSQLSRERRGHTLQTTDLVHEAFVRLVDQRAGWQNRLHFYGIAARCMRRILVDHARKKRAAKRPPADAALDLDQTELAAGGNLETLLMLDQALDRLAGQSPRQAQVAELKIFAQLEIADISTIVGVSDATVKRDWGEARKQLAAWLTEPP